MSDRFYSSHPIATGRATLDGHEAHHLLHVMRAAIGDPVVLFDDSGAEFTAVVESLGRSHAELRVTARHEINRELPVPLEVGVALPKGDRQKWLVEKLTELGVTTLVPLVTERGVAQPTAASLERLRRSIVEAAKQCGRNRLMTISEPHVWDEWLSALGWLRSQSAAGGEPPEVLRLVAHPSGKPLHEHIAAIPRPTQLAIGPEGGLTESEIAFATDAGWQTVDLGPRILRVETAAVALAAAIALR